MRLPDVYARMHAAGKASTLGVMCILLSAGIFFPDQLGIVLILILLFFVTGPIATTTMARAAYRTDPARSFVLHYDDLAEYEEERAEEAAHSSESHGRGSRLDAGVAGSPAPHLHPPCRALPTTHDGNPQQ